MIRAQDRHRIVDVLVGFRATRMPFLATWAVTIVREVAEIIRDLNEIECRLTRASFDQRRIILLTQEMHPLFGIILSH